MDMEKEVKAWGLPVTLEKEVINYEFRDNLKTEYGAKFILKSENGNEIFIMDFISPQPDYQKLRSNSEKYLVLHYVEVPKSEYRKKGIAKFFLEKLAIFAEKNKFSVIRISAHPQKKYDIKDALNSEELKQFYKKYLNEDKKIKIEFI